MCDLLKFGFHPISVLFSDWKKGEVTTKAICLFFLGLSNLCVAAKRMSVLLTLDPFHTCGLHINYPTCDAVVCKGWMVVDSIVVDGTSLCDGDDAGARPADTEQHYPLPPN